MYDLVIEVFQIKELAGGSDVPISIPVCLYLSINTGKKHKMTHIEFPVIVQKWSVNVRLNDIRQRKAIFVFVFFDQFVYISKC